MGSLFAVLALGLDVLWVLAQQPLPITSPTSELQAAARRSQGLLPCLGGPAASLGLEIAPHGMRPLVAWSTTRPGSVTKCRTSPQPRATASLAPGCGGEEPARAEATAAEVPCQKQLALWVYQEASPLKNLRGYCVSKAKSFTWNGKSGTLHLVELFVFG